MMQGRMKLSCVRYMLLLIPRSIMCALCEGPCSFPQWQCLAVCSMGSGVPVQSVRVPLQLFLSCCFWSGICQLSLTGMLLLIGCRDQCLCGFIWVFSWDVIVCVHYIVCVCDTQCMGCVGVISGIFSLFFVMW